METNVHPRKVPSSRALCATLACALLATLAACGGNGNDNGSFSALPIAPTTPSEPVPTAGKLAVDVLSSRPDMVTGGDVLIQVSGTVPMSQVKVTLNGSDVTAMLVADASSATLSGVVRGLTVGQNSVVATGSGETASLPLTNYPITGPVLSGPHKAPYECRTVESGLGMPLDADCSATKQVTYFYRNTAGTFQPMSVPTARPADLTTTKTTEGKTVPYIVRVEGGTNNRSIYRIAMLDDPSTTTVNVARYSPSSSWNRKAVVYFGGGCGNQYNQGVFKDTDALDDATLSQGYAYLISTELYNQVRCNPHLQGEALMMLKEYFIKTYAKPKWIVGTGGSGGAIQQYVIAQIFPGLLDGIQPSVSFPDSQMEDIFGCSLLRKRVYPLDTARWTSATQIAIEGFSPGTCAAWTDFYNFAGYPDSITGVAAPNLAPYQAGNIPCGLKDQSKKFDPRTNPTGARCDVYTSNINSLGAQADGTVRRPFDNVGLQYGLNALNAGTLSVDDFLTANENIGGYDNDGQPIAVRSVADPIAVRNAYASGLKNSFQGGIPLVPIVVVRQNGSGAGDIHARLQDFVIRARIQAANGRSDNQIILTSDPRGMAAAKVDLSALSLQMIDRWLDALSADPAPLTTDKIVRLKPSDALDTCWLPDGTKVVEVAAPGNNACNTAFPVASSPTFNAGAPLSNDAYKCQLKPITVSDYQAVFSLAQQARLSAIFPNGVCDWTKPGAGKVPLQGTFIRLPLS